MRAIDLAEAIKTVKRKITNLNAMKIQEQKKAVRSGYDMDILPSNLATCGTDAKQLLSKQIRNERLFMVTLLMLIVQDQIWGRVTANRIQGKATWYFADEFHLLLKEEQTAAYSAEIRKRFRKWGGIPTGVTQNVKDLLSSSEIENILETATLSAYSIRPAATVRFWPNG